ncbi:DNA ligase 4 [Malaya genurostris]|uniref:DNA ligase 4 n=1 Tax=Malaya genurostris TaxID=325434 RepID=UPI0026F38A33|nr:DNA ligase 4 [Malaya genurostris]
MSELQCISKHVKFSEISAILEKVKSTKIPAKRDQTLRRYFTSFFQFQKEFRQKYGDSVPSSIFPILRLLLPTVDRERDSYGLRIKSLRDMYVKVLGISDSSVEAQKLSGFDDSGSGSAGGGDFAERVFTLMRGRCPQECRLTVWDINNRLDAIGKHYHNGGQRLKIQDELILMIEGLTQLDQKWLVRIILKNLRLGVGQQKLLSLYHPKAGLLFDRFSNLSKVCEVVENGEDLAELQVQKTEMSVQIFNPVKPMLCQRVNLKIVNDMLQKEEFWLETKMDGERFQIHKDRNVFKYFSRNTIEYSRVFGETSNHSGSSLTPCLSSLLSTTVQSMILDGEMMVFDKIELTYHDKCENTDVKNIKGDNPSIRPCFCVYDILYLNGKSLLTVPYAERIRLLGTVVKESPGILTYCRRTKVENSEHLVQLLNQAIDARQEGVVIKKQDSVYSPNERNAGWYKIKPDYIDNLVSDFDLLILGGFYNYKKTAINTWLVGVLDSRPTNDKDTPSFSTVTKVAMGLSNDQWKLLNTSLRPHWREVLSQKVGRSTISEEPPGLHWGRTPPNVWIPPKHSIVLQLKGSELVRSDSYGTTYTIRFPRVMAIRSDKSYLDVCTKQEFDQLCTSNTSVTKLAKRHVTASDLISDTGSTGSNRKRKRSSAVQSRRVVNFPHAFDSVAAVLEVQQIDSICSGLDFCVLTSAKNCPPVTEIESMILRHGGRLVKNPGPKTYAVVAGDRTFRVERIIDSGKYNVVSIEWLIRALAGSEPRQELLKFKPNDMLAITPETQKQMADQFDRFGDCLISPITSLDEMRALLKQMNVDGLQLSVSELQQGQIEILGKTSGFRIFSGIVARLYDANLDDDVDRYKSKFCMLKFVRAGGQWVPNEVDNCVSNIFVLKNEALSSDHLKQWIRSFPKQNIEPKILQLEWIKKCLCDKSLCETQLYRVF